LVDLELTPPKAYHLSLEIIHEDDDIAVILKPAGINVSGNQFKTIQNALLYNLKESTKADKLPWPLPVHRLDNQTSGLLIIAKTKTSRIRLGRAFEKREIQKKYHALVIGNLEENGTINTPIENKSSTSHFSKIATVPSLKNTFLSLVELAPVTGRTHQLRIHCAAIGFPILGDKIYGEEGMVLKHKGLFLSAVSLEFSHPIDGHKISLQIPTPLKFIRRMENEKRRFNATQKFT